MKSPKPTANPAETARANGSKSHGPVTPEGRAKSSRNSLRHGLTAETVVLEKESQEEFDALLNAFVDRFHPADPVEQELVEAMTAARWRLRRLYTIESRILEIEFLRRADSLDEEFSGIDDPDRLAYAFQSLADNGRSLALLVRYEAGLNRAFDRAFKQLILLQSSPPSAPVPHTPVVHTPVVHSPVVHTPDDTPGSFRNPRNPPAPTGQNSRPFTSMNEPVSLPAPPPGPPHPREDRAPFARIEV